MRIRCHLLGCKSGDRGNVPTCRRCGAHGWIPDPAPVERGWLDRPASALCRLGCRLFGCRPHGTMAGSGCRRCGAPYYGDEFRDRGRLLWAVWCYWQVRWWLSWPRCGQCRKRLWPLVGGTDQHGLRFCGQECADEWLPF